MAISQVPIIIPPAFIILDIQLIDKGFKTVKTYPRAN